MFRCLKRRRYYALRKKAIAKCRDEQLLTLFESTPSLRTPWSELEFIVIDLETTGLDPATSHIVSLGSVAIKNCRVQLNSSSHQIIRSEHLVGSSAEVHGLRDQDLLQGEELECALRSLIECIANRVVVFHYSELDQSMLNDVFSKYFGAPFVLPMVDTMKLAKRVFSHEQMPADGFRLSTLRKRVGLPNAKQHNALSDSIATAELLLVLMNRLDRSGRTPIVDYL